MKFFRNCSRRQKLVKTLTVIFSLGLIFDPQTFALAKVKTQGLEQPMYGKLATDKASDASSEYPSDNLLNDSESDTPVTTEALKAEKLQTESLSADSVTTNSLTTDPGATTAGNLNQLKPNEMAGYAELPLSLPMNGPVDKTTTATAGGVTASGKQYTGSITVLDNPAVISKQIDELLDSALSKDNKTEAINKAVAHFNTTTQKLIGQSKDATDYLIPFRGFGPSSEASDIILDEKLKLKSKAASEYAKQAEIDDKHEKIVSMMSQIAMGLGVKDKSRSQAIVTSGKTELAQLVGDDEANKTVTSLSTWANSLDVPESIYKQDVWDVSKRENKLKVVSEAALTADPIVQEVKNRLHKYNHKSKFANASAHVVETTLGVASMTPTFIGPAAKSALTAFVMATGGPESCKLMKELYLDKRYESRAKVVDDEAHLALDNYHVALLTHNDVLLAFSESLVAQMAGNEKVAQILGASVLSYAATPDTDSKEVCQKSNLEQTD
jgi:hypothetical protein